MPKQFWFRKKRLFLLAKSKFLFANILLFFLFTSISCYRPDKQNNLPELLLLVANRPANLLILGDSLSNFSNSFGIQNALGKNYIVRDLSVPGRDIRDWLVDLERGFSPLPDLVILPLGTNDAVNYPTSEFPQRLNDLLTRVRIRSASRILLVCPPLTESPTHTRNIATNNSYVRTLSSQYPVSDWEEVFRTNSNLDLYPSLDPIHPNPIGNQLIGARLVRDILQIR